MRKALKRMKNGKAVGPGDLLVDLWKCLGDRAEEFLTKLFNMFLNSEKMPGMEDRCTGADLYEQGGCAVLKHLWRDTAIELHKEDLRKSSGSEAKR